VQILSSSEQDVVIEFGASIQSAVNLSLSKNINMYVEIVLEGSQPILEYAARYPFDYEVTVT
jgi:hypothetical protein